ncbi:transposase [Bacillus thuringiensis]|nr:transposase [Bacillus thuringiensis]PNK48080.1 transposase [Bacillus thuringiensis]
MEVNQMMINKAFKFRIYPNKAQAILINKTLVVLSLYSIISHAYKETGTGLTYGTCSAKLPASHRSILILFITIIAN